ncbi:MAG: hypothetical protein IPJ28_15120 [Betaproteobacteria bacterium]|nr:hypothetical protein [Betaproteobacteria bacterium]
MALALLVSLLIHLPLLGLTFGGDGTGLPGFDLPWKARRVEAPDLRVLLLPARVAAPEPEAAALAKPLPPSRVEPPIAAAVTPPPRSALRERQATTVALEPESRRSPTKVGTRSRRSSPSPPPRGGAAPRIDRRREKAPETISRAGHDRAGATRGAHFRRSRRSG